MKKNIKAMGILVFALVLLNFIPGKMVDKVYAQVENPGNLNEFNQAVVNGDEIVFDGGNHIFEMSSADDHIMISQDTKIKLINDAKVTIQNKGFSNAIEFTAPNTTLTLWGDGTGKFSITGNGSSNTERGIEMGKGGVTNTNLILEDNFGVLEIEGTGGYGISRQHNGESTLTMNGGVLNILNTGNNDGGEGGIVWTKGQMDFNAGQINIAGAGGILFGAIYTGNTILNFGDGDNEILEVNLSNAEESAVKNTVQLSSSSVMNINEDAKVSIKILGKGGNSSSGETSVRGINGSSNSTLIVNGGRLTFSENSTAYIKSSIQSVGKIYIQDGSTVTSPEIVNKDIYSSSGEVIFTGGSTLMRNQIRVVEGIVNNDLGDKVSSEPVNDNGDPLTRFDLTKSANKTINMLDAGGNNYKYKVGEGHNGLQYVWAPRAKVNFVFIKSDKTEVDVPLEGISQAPYEYTVIRGSELAVSEVETPDDRLEVLKSDDKLEVISWFTDKALTEHWNPNTPITEDITLYAGEQEKTETSQPPTIDKIKVGDKIVSGTGIPGSTVKVTLPDGSVIKNIPVKEDGTWSIVIDTPLKVDNIISATQTEGGKLPSDSAEIKVKEKKETIGWIGGLGPVLGDKEDYKDHIQYIQGYPDGSVRPDGKISRAEAAAMISRLLKIDIENDSAPDYTDMSESGWYNKYINAVTEYKLMSGYPDGSFKAEGDITRAEFAKMIQSIDKASSTDTPFSDIEDHWAEDAIKQAYGNSRIDGYPDGSFAPDKPITRTEATKIFNRLFERMLKSHGIESIKEGKINKFNDLLVSHWGYYEIVEASNIHEYGRYEDGLEEYWNSVNQRTWDDIKK